MKMAILSISTLLLLTSCQSSPSETTVPAPTSKVTANTPPTDTTALEAQVSLPCIDTFLLNQMNVQHRTILKEDKEKWILKFTKSVDLVRNITTLSYFYSCSIKPKDCNNAKRWFQVDSILVQLEGGEIQTLMIQENTAGTNLEGLNTPDSKLVDVNFDGYADVEMGMNEVSGNSNEMRRYFIYNPAKGAFENGMDLVNLTLDKETKLIYNGWNGGHAGRISGRTWSSFVGYDSIHLEKAINSDFNRELEAYVVETIELNSMGLYETKVDTVKYEDWE